MKDKKVIAYKNLPGKFPGLLTAVAFLYLDQYNAPGWVWGVSWTILGIFWILSIVVKAFEQETDIFDENQNQQP